MMRPFHLGTLLLIAGVFTMSEVRAQTGEDKKDKEKLRDGGEITVIKDARPTIKNSARLKTDPEKKESNAKAPEVKYNFLSKKMDTPFEVAPIKAASLKPEPRKQLYRSYAKLGVGNYRTTFADIYVNSLRSRETNTGVHLRHLASGGGIDGVGENGYSQNSLSLFGKRFLKKHTIEGSLDYDRRVVHFYGFNPADFQNDTTGVLLGEDDIRQRFSRIGGQGRWRSFYRDSTKINHTIGLRAQHLTDLYDVKETRVVADSRLNRFYNGEEFVLGAMVDFNRYSGSPDTISNAIIDLRPQIVTRRKNWKMELGLGITVNADTNAEFHFYPHAQFQYNVLKDLIVPYAGVTGQVKRNSFDSFSRENPFIVSGPQLRNSNHKYDAYGGIRGAYSSKISFNLRASRSRVENMALFVNDTTDGVGNRFQVVYDTVDVVNLRAEVSYQLGDKLSLTGRGDFFSYQTTNEFEAWHMPDYRLTFTGMYDLLDKIVLRSEVYVISNRTARTFDPSDDISYARGIYGKTLKGVVDVNLGIEYRYTDRLSAFLNLQNLGSAQYMQWNEYPTQRFNVLGGLSYSFWGN